LWWQTGKAGAELIVGALEDTDDTDDTTTEISTRAVSFKDNPKCTVKT